MVSLGVWWPKAIIDKPIVRDWNVGEWQRSDSGVAVAERGRSYKSKSTPIMIYNEVIDCWNHHCLFGQGDGKELVKSTLMAPWLFLPESESKVAQSRPTLWDPMDCNLAGSSIHGVFPGKNTAVGCHLPDPVIELGLPHCRQTLYCLRHWGSQKERI